MKAQAGNWSVIVASIIGLVVLVTVIVLLIGNVGLFAREATDCENKGGICSRSCSTDNGFYQVQLSCTQELPKCCLKGEDFVPTEVIVRDGS